MMHNNEITYCKYFEFENWLYVKERLIDYFQRSNIEDIWYPISLAEMERDIPDIVELLKKSGAIPLQLIFIQFPGPTDLTSTDPDDPKTVYIHIDHSDEDEHATLEITRAPTNFVPTHVLNIPLINCESSITLFYELKDKTKNELPWGGWGIGPKEAGITVVDHSNVTLVDTIVLDKPAILKIDVPHAVHNPTPDLRIVASIRISEESVVLYD
jgi:hypothetical protein